MENTLKTGELVDAKVGRNGGTWAHPKLAVFFARWLDTKFAVFCDMVIDDILNKKAELTITQPAESMAMKVPQSFPEALRLAAELAEKNEQLALENKEMAPKAVVFDNCVALRQESLATFVRTFEGMKCSLQPPNSIEVHCLHNRSQHLRPEVFTVAAEGDATGLMP